MINRCCRQAFAAWLATQPAGVRVGTLERCPLELYLVTTGNPAAYVGDGEYRLAAGGREENMEPWMIKFTDWADLLLPNKEGWRHITAAGARAALARIEGEAS